MGDSNNDVPKVETADQGESSLEPEFADAAESRLYDPSVLASLQKQLDDEMDDVAELLGDLKQDMKDVQGLADTIDEGDVVLGLEGEGGIRGALAGLSTHSDAVLKKLGQEEEEEKTLMDAKNDMMKELAMLRAERESMEQYMQLERMKDTLLNLSEDGKGFDSLEARSAVAQILAQMENTDRLQQEQASSSGVGSASGTASENAVDLLQMMERENGGEAQDVGEMVSKMALMDSELDLEIQEAQSQLQSAAESRAELEKMKKKLAFELDSMKALEEDQGGDSP